MPKPYDSAARQQPVKVIAPRPANTIAQALANSQTYFDQAKKGK